MKPVRPFRKYSVYSSPCMECGEEIESAKLPVPELCPSCQAKKDRDAKSPQETETGTVAK